MVLPVFVFGSNTAGRHGLGAALWARNNRGAIYGVAEGMQGNSYGIPTRFANPIGNPIPGVRSLTLEEIAIYVNNFKEFAAANKRMQFLLTPIGCGKAGHKHSDIGPMFAGVSANVIICPEFKPFI